MSAADGPKLFDALAFANRLRDAMHARRVDQKTASAQMRVHRSTLCRMLAGKAPDVENFCRMVAWLGASDAKRPCCDRPGQMQNEGCRGCPARDRVNL